MIHNVLITGASSGIGRSCAFRFAASGAGLILTGRRIERLKAIEEEITRSFGVKVLSIEMDVADREGVARALNNLPEDMEPDVLINNAGLALGLDLFQDGNPEFWDRMIDTNVKGLLNVTHCIVPGMIRKGRGHIINIGSVAGREVYAKGNVYCASKAAVDSITRALRMDLLVHGIRVSQIAPGAVETEFSVVRFGGDLEKAGAVYNGFQPLHPDDVAEVVHYAAMLPPHVNINDLLLMPTAQASATQINRK
ncbi:MAG: SDR family NAD(P)-dependent oxidoreductase [Bacteroidales bacterium]|jgi:NADP-dependent 3-hydroxy acid dehydrogenase YdfG|nr:SDR family NAD(P)-dependent oxidoreductase [Bacteroidales bacterium]